MSFEYLIGTASSVVTPDLGCQMAGFDARKGVAHRVHDDLHARALVLDDGKTQVVFVSIEILGLSGAFARRVQTEIERRTGIPAAYIVLAATHTHCGPVTFHHFFNQGQPLDETYLDRLASGIVASVEQARANCRPRRLHSGFITVDNIAVNRRTADGQPIDPNAGVFLIEELDGTPVAVAINYACHTTVLGPNTLDITADFPYYTSRFLQQKLGTHTEVLFFNGAEGDISVGHKSDLSAVGVIAPFRTFEKAEELGLRLGQAVFAGLPTLGREDSALKVDRSTVPLPLKTYAPLSVMKDHREAALVAVRDLESTNQTDELLRARQRGLFSRIQEYYAWLWEQGEDPEPKTLPAEIVAVRVGNTAILTFPGEVFVGIALDIRARSPFSRTMFFGLTNDYIGYVPTRDANADAGYEVVASRVTPSAAGILAQGAVELLNRLAAQ